MDLDEHTRLQRWQNVFTLRKVDGKPLNIHLPTDDVEPKPLELKAIDTSLLSAPHLVLSDFVAGMLKIPFNYKYSLS